MINFTEIPQDGEVWELFARDFLQELGFFIESSPDRGPDGGKDLLITENLRGNLGNYRLQWLVSCKHFALSNNSVTERDEINIQERLDAYSADGFIGFYSTVPSSGLNTRLNNLRQNNKIKDFKFFDHKLIENYLIKSGFSQLLMRYFPLSYRMIRPLHTILEEYVPLKCAVCGKDLLEVMYAKEYEANILFTGNTTSAESGIIYHINDIRWVCKNPCDRSNSSRNYTGEVIFWKDIDDIAIPAEYLRWIFTHLNMLQRGKVVYTNIAFEKLKSFILALAQKVLRETTPKEKEKVQDMIDNPFF